MAKGYALVTGFDVFHYYHYNPTAELVEELDGTVVSGLRIRGIVLSVSLKRATELLEELLRELEPDVVLGLGFAPQADRVVLELAACNAAFFKYPDVDGYLARGEEVVRGGRLVIETTLPVKEVVKRCTIGRGLPLAPGLSIGTYLCNAVGYVVMSYGRRKGVPAGFLHVPPTSDAALRLRLQSKVSWREALECVLCVLEVAAEQVTSRA